MKVLIVDDSAIIRRVVEQILEMLGHLPVQASDGVEGLERLEAHPDVALILLDWDMPRMDGLEFLRAVKRRPALQDIPVIMLTSGQDRRRMIEAIEAGAKHHLTKPFQPDALARKIAQCAGADPAAALE